MKRTAIRRRRFQLGGLAALVAGAMLFAAALLAAGPSGASGTSGTYGCVRPACALTVSPDSGLAFASPVSVNGSNFSPGAIGALMECNLTPGEPTVAVTTIKNFGSVPVGCSSPQRVRLTVSKGGTFATGLGIGTNIMGPPALGTDSSGGSAAVDTNDYPCPPTEAQFDAGDSCAILFQDIIGKRKKPKHEQAFNDISFTTDFSTTTTTTSPTTTTTVTTPPGCTAVPTGGSGLNTSRQTIATVTVDPGSCLVGGLSPTITAVGLVPSSLGSFVECNSDPTQPTVAYLGTAIPVSCSKPVLFSTGADGSIPAASQRFTVIEGTVGPPSTGTDSGGNSATADAANFPCPPTPAQVSAGDTCQIDVGDIGGDKVAVPIWFSPTVGS